MLKGLETRIRLPRLGIIRLGITVIEPGKKPYPREVEYFVLPEELKPLLGDRPKRITVMFPSDEVDRNLSAAYEKRSGKALDVRCDGERALWLLAQGGTESFACPKEPRKACPRGCQAKGHLNVIIPTAPIGSWWILIGGEQRLADLWSELVIFKETFGRLTDIVFEVERVPSQIQVRTERGVIARTGHPVHLRCAIAAEQALRVRGMNLRDLPGGQVLPGERAALPEAEDEAVSAEAENGGDVPSNAGVSSAEPPILPSRPTPASDPALMPWTIEACFAAAQRAGIEPVDYELYLAHKYRMSIENLVADHLDREGDAWSHASDNPLARETLRSVILTIVGKARKGAAQ